MISFIRTSSQGQTCSSWSGETISMWQWWYFYDDVPGSSRRQLQWHFIKWWALNTGPVMFHNQQHVEQWQCFWHEEWEVHRRKLRDLPLDVPHAQLILSRADRSFIAIETQNTHSHIWLVYKCKYPTILWVFSSMYKHPLFTFQCQWYAEYLYIYILL